MTFQDLKKQLQQRKFKPIYLLQGEETYFVDQLTQYIEKNVLDEASRSFNQTILYGKETNSDTILTAARRAPMMSEYQVVMVKEAQNLRDILKLEKYAQRPLPSTILVLAYKYKSLRKNTKLVKAIAKNGLVFTAKKLYEKQIPAWIEQYVTVQKYRIDYQAILLLTEYLGTNLSKITNELDKLMLNVPSSTKITEQHISDNIGISKDYNIFELQKALGQKQVTKVFKIVSYFNRNPKAAPFPLIIGSLYNFFSRIFLFHHYKNQSDTSLQQTLGLHNKFFLQQYRTAAQNYSLGRTKKCIRLLQIYDLKFKGVNNIQTPDTELLKEMIVRMLY